MKNGNIYISPEGIHFLDYLDPIENISSEIPSTPIKKEDKEYIEKLLQSNNERFENQVNIVKKFIKISTSKFINIGCGGGLFLSKIKNLGGDVVGIELSDNRVLYARSVHGLKVHKRPIENFFWFENYSEYFDVVTIWDVIEHVNFPLSTIKATLRVLKKDGFIFIDTPCRDSFYHKFGELTV